MQHRWFTDRFTGPSNAQPHIAEYVVISDDSGSTSPENSPVPSPVPLGAKLAMVHDMFTQVSAGQMHLLLDLYRNNVDLVVQVIFEEVSLTSLLTEFNKMVSVTKMMSVRSSHIVEDTLRLLYKGKFVVSSRNCRSACS